jgi:hypothetical protein
MPITIPDFIVKQRVVRPDLLEETPDPLTDVTHEEWNALVALARATAQTVNSGDLIYEMPIATSSIASPRRMNTAGGAFTDTSKSATIAASASVPSRDVLRLAATVQGGWMWPLVDVPDLPADGFVLDLEIDEAGDSGGGIPIPSVGFVDLVSPGGSDTVAGLQILGGAVGNIQLSVIPLGAGYADPDSPFATLTAWGTAPTPSELAKGTCRMVIEFRRLAAVDPDPAEWSIAITTYSTDGQVYRVARSCVSDPSADLDDRSFSAIALGLWNDSGSAGAANFSVARLRIRAL